MNSFLESSKRMRKYLVVAIPLFCSSGYVSAMDFSYGYFLPVETEYDSNIQMVENNKKSIMLYKFIPRISFIARDELDTYKLDAGLLIQRSSNEKISEDREDPNLGLSWQREFDRGSFSLSTDYSKSSSRTSEFTQSGLVFNDGSTISRSYNGNVTYALSDKIAWASGLGYRTHRYTGSNLLSDYNSKYFNTRFSYLYSEKLTPFVSYSIDKYEQDGSSTVIVSNNNGGNSISNNYSAGFSYQIDPKLNLDMSAGVNHVNSSGSEWIGSTGLNWTYEKSTLTAKLHRDVSASGLGGFQKSDNFTMAYAYQITQNDSAGVDTSWNRNRSINDTDSKDIGVWYSKNLSDSWTFRTHARYRNLKGSNQDADGYLLGVLFGYNKPNF
ncbi:MAG: hypothetical protein ACO1N8_13025 [Methylophilus sp.]|jgi:hypothetical protein